MSDTGTMMPAEGIKTAVEAEPLIVSASPHQKRTAGVSHLMLWVTAALVPASAIAVTLYGPGSLYSILLSITAAAAAEWLILLYLHKKPSIPDGSAALTGLLLALSLPQGLPLWVAPAGSLFAIAFVKMAFGGIGRNFLNPALAGRAFLVVAFPSFFATTEPGTIAALPAGSEEIRDTLFNCLVGYQNSWIGGTSAGALCIGAVLLCSLRVIDFTVPVSYIGTTFLLFWVTGSAGTFFSSTALVTPLLPLLCGGVLFGAIFLATDPVTSPATTRARIVFGIGCGALTFLFQKFGASNDSVMQAILLMNCMTPWLDRYGMHRSFGARRDLYGTKRQPAAGTGFPAAEEKV